MKLKLQTYAAIAIAALMLAAPASVRADAVSYWNGVAVQATATAARPGPSGVLDIAMVQAAIYDAVQAIEGDYQPYYSTIPGASGSPIGAAAKAARDVLVSRFPAQTAAIDDLYQHFLDGNDVPSNDPGLQVGAAAAAGIIALRSNDGSFPVPPPPPFIGGTEIGQWRPTPPANAPMVAPWLGSVTPFTLRRSSQMRALPPPALDSPEYTRDYNEVKALGSLNNSSRSAEQTDMAHFFNMNYVVVWNKVMRDLAGANVDNISDSSRLFALADMAMADAIITAWDSKRHYVFWRPLTAIQFGEDDGNPKTDGDPAWLPLIVNPAYPDYTSGANNITASATRSFSLFFGTNEMTFDVTTTNTGPTQQDTRTYHKFSDVRDDVVSARVYEGIHFRFADEAARKQGERIAQWAFGHHLRPIGDSK